MRLQLDSTIAALKEAGFFEFIPQPLLPW